MARRIQIINGPNLNLLGLREPEIYGRQTLADIEKDCARLARELGLECGFFQSNHEGRIIDRIQQARETADGIIINPGGFTHTSIAILDALNAFEGPVIEVHLSNIHRREAFRHKSFVSLRADGVLAGFGAQGYLLALRRMAAILE